MDCTGCNPGGLLASPRSHSSTAVIGSLGGKSLWHELPWLTCRRDAPCNCSCCPAFQLMRRRLVQRGCPIQPHPEMSQWTAQFLRRGLRRWSLPGPCMARPTVKMKLAQLSASLLAWSAHALATAHLVQAIADDARDRVNQRCAFQEDSSQVRNAPEPSLLHIPRPTTIRGGTINLITWRPARIRLQTGQRQVPHWFGKVPRIRLAAPRGRHSADPSPAAVDTQHSFFCRSVSRLQTLMEEETNPLRRRAAPKESSAQSSRMENAEESSLKRGGGRVLARWRRTSSLLLKRLKSRRIAR
eukprot:scaffold817_cov246-Pinguiococcus_pyrenoidosus.AAC.4